MQERSVCFGGERKKRGSLLPQDFALQPVEEVLILARSVSFFKLRKTAAERRHRIAWGVSPQEIVVELSFQSPGGATLDNVARCRPSGAFRWKIDIIPGAGAPGYSMPSLRD